MGDAPNGDVIPVRRYYIKSPALSANASYFGSVRAASGGINLMAPQ